MEKLIKILYVDDEPINLELFKITYEDVFEVLLAESGSKGLELIEKEDDIKFVVSDMKMPVMNGMEFIRKLKQIKSELPCVILSGYQKDNEIVQAIMDRVLVDYVMKPFDNIQLQFLINKTLNI
jgi:two-component system, response regulator, stage 0 sporulation protein F